MILIFAEMILKNRKNAPWGFFVDFFNTLWYTGTKSVRDMSMEDFVIVKFEALLAVHDPKGRIREFVDRGSSSFIITRKGKIRFSYPNGFVTAQAGRPVFLPKGFSYTNECLEAAESYVFNFQTLHTYEEPMQLASISDARAAEYYEQICAKIVSPSLYNTLSILEIMYSLSCCLLRECKASGRFHPTVEKAMSFLRQNYGRAGLTAKDAAVHCCISEVYLRKLFERELHSTPFRELTKIRMEKAKMMTEEKRPQKEIAESVGYADVFQFCRAFKRYFGYPPSKSQ